MADENRAYQHGKILPRAVEKEMKTSYLDYAMSVIVGRALPDVRDGLKPVHRRILFAMYELSNTHDKPHKKSARVVGECFVKGTLVLAKRGLVPIEEIEKGEIVYTQAGKKRVNELYEMPERELVDVTLENGVSVRVTPDQMLKVLNDKLEFEWKAAKELAEGEVVVLRAEYPDIAKSVHLGELDGRRIELNENIGYLLGQLLSDGWVEKGGRRGYPFRCGFCSDSKQVMSRIVQILEEEFSQAATLEEREYEFETSGGQVLLKRIYSVRINSSALNQFLVSAFSLQNALAETKEIPAQILVSPKKVIYAFLSGLIDGDGSLHANRNIIHYGSVSEKLIGRLQILLQHFGIMSARYVNADLKRHNVGVREVKENYPFHYLEIRSRFATELLGQLKLYDEAKAKRLAEGMQNLKQSAFDAIPYAGKALFSELSEKHLGSGWYETAQGQKFRSGIKYPNGTKIKYSLDLQGKPLGRQQIAEWGIGEKLEKIGSHLSPFINGVLENSIYFVKVKKVVRATPEKTYDMQVEEEHEFIANGIVSHNCLGKFHPHGDVAIYDSMVRMAQDFSMRYMLVDGQGNFGSVDADAAAAMRYTEARLSKFAEEILTDLEKETVAFTPNFDATLKEPTVLPCRVPNLIVNGSSGIAVGMATNMAPHNLSETVDALVAMIDKPDMPPELLRTLIPGPDFPTGGYIVGRRGIADAYSTGRGIVRVRGKAEIITSKEKRTQIVITEMPYQVNKAEFIKHVAELARDKKLEGIADIADRSDRKGMHVEIVVKKDANADVVLNQLYAHTELEGTFGINNLALVNNEPKTLSMPSLLTEFLSHRREVVKKRSAFDLRIAQERKHLVEGLLLAVSKIDAVIKVVKTAKVPLEALMNEFKLSQKQAEAILEMKIRKLSALESGKLKDEDIELSKTIDYFTGVLADEKKIYGIIRAELMEVKQKYGDKRRTEIIDDDGEVEMEDLIAEEDVAVIITQDDYIKRVPISEYRAQRRGGKGVIGSETKEEDQIKDIMLASTHDYLLFFTDKGDVHWLKVYRIPTGGRYAMGKAIVNLLSLSGEKIAAWVKTRTFSDKEFLVMLTKKGTVKRSSMADYSRPRNGGIIAITLKEGDALIDAKKTDGKRELILATAEGNAIRFKEDDVREIGRTGQGVIGIRLEDKDEVVGMATDETETLMIVTENGYGKRTDISEYRLQSRGGKGVINIKTHGRNGLVVGIAAVKDSDSLLLVSSGGKMIRLFVKDVSIIGRNTGGVRLMKMDEGEKVVALEKVAADADDGNGKDEGSAKQGKAAEEKKDEPPKPPPASPPEQKGKEAEKEGVKKEAKGKKAGKEDKKKEKEDIEPIIIA